MKDKPYREAVASWMYLALDSRPDMSDVVGILTRFYNNPGLAHWNAVKHVFAYLAGSKYFEMWYGEKVFLEGYSERPQVNLGFTGS